MRVTLVITSSFAGLLTFAEMSVCFSGDTLIRRFAHDGSGSGDSVGGFYESEEDLTWATDNAATGKKDRRPSLSGLVASNSSQPTKASLVFPARKPITFSFLIFVPENSFSASALATDPCIFVEKMLFTIASPPKSIRHEESALVNMPNAVISDPSGPKDDEDPSGQQPIRSLASTDNVQDTRQVIFLVSTLTKAFISKRESFGKGVTLKDICQFLPRKDCPALLQIERLGATLELVYPARVPIAAGTTVTIPSTSTASIFAPPTVQPTNPTLPGTIQLLQGPIQRINLVFKANGSSIINGKLYLSSDFPVTSGTNDNQQHLFWYPDVTGLDGTTTATTTDSTCLHDPNLLDSVKFHPFKLSSSLQPSQPILLPTQHGSDSMFCVPIFVKSELHTTVTVKLLVEYVPKQRLSTSVTKDFEFKVRIKTLLLL